MKNTSVILLILLIGLTIIMSGCLSNETNENQPEKVNTTNQNESDDDNIEYTEKIISNVVLIEKIDDLELNSHPSFSIGQKFFYKTSSIPVQEGYYFEEQIFTLNGIERITGIEYYVIIRNLTGYVSADPTNTAFVESFESIINTWYCDKENGKCIGKNINPEKYLDENMFVTDSSLFAYWMLGLKENLRWNMYLNATQETAKDEYLKVNQKYEFEVIGKEKVNGMLCFKVKMIYIDTDTKEVRYVRNYWIDVERRILIKKEEFESGIRIYEQNLIKED